MPVAADHQQIALHLAHVVQDLLDRSADATGRHRGARALRGERLELPLGFAHPLFHQVGDVHGKSLRRPGLLKRVLDYVDKMQGGTQPLCEIIGPAHGQLRGWAKIGRTDDPLVVGHDSLTGHVAIGPSDHSNRLQG